MKWPISAKLIISSSFSSISLFFRSEEHTSELQSQSNLVCRLLLEKKNTTHTAAPPTRTKSNTLTSVYITLTVTTLVLPTRKPEHEYFVSMRPTIDVSTIMTSLRS